MLYLKKKERKIPESVIFLHLCTKILDDMIYSVQDIEYDRLKLVIMGHFLRHYASPSFLKHHKIRILKKWKNLLEISSFYTCVPKTTII